MLTCLGNIPFTIGDDKELWEKIMKEVKLGRYAGPFKNIPFTNHVQSPIGLVPKDGGKQTRLIFHLSYKFANGNQSINFWTPAEKCSVHYNDVDHAVKNCLHILKGTNLKCVFFGKTDLKSAFRILGLKRKHWFLLIMYAIDPETKEKWYFVDKCLPFGASISCSHFQRFSNSLRHIVEVLENHFNSLTNYLDDFLFYHYLRSICERLMERFMQVCKLINFPVSLEKTEWSSPRMIFLGILLNGRNQTLLILEAKVNKAINLINRLCEKRKATIREIQVLTGTLNFLNKAIVPGRVFTRRLYAKAAGKMVSKQGVQLKPFHHVHLDLEFRNDCQVWKLFLNNQGYAARPFLDLSQNVAATDLSFFTDASKNENFGFGCYFRGRWTFGRWEPNYIKQFDPSIAYLELYALCIGIFAWEHCPDLNNKRILIHCDNESVVSMVNNMTSSCQNCMYLLRMLTLNNMLHNRRITVIYVQSQRNELADALSRMKFELFFKLAPLGVKHEPTELPKQLWPASKIWLS